MDVANTPRYHAGSSPFNYLLGDPQTHPYMFPARVPSWGQRLVAWVRPESEHGLLVRRYVQARGHVMQARNEWSIRSRKLIKVLCGPNDRWLRDNLPDRHERRLASEFRVKLRARGGAHGTFQSESLSNEAWRNGAAALMKAADSECARAKGLLDQSGDEPIPQRHLERIKRAVLVERQGAWLVGLAPLPRVDGEQAEPTWEAIQTQQSEFEFQVRLRDNKLRAGAPQPGWSLCGGTDREPRLTRADLLAARDRLVDFLPVRIVVMKPAAVQVPAPAALRELPPTAPATALPVAPRAEGQMPIP